MAAELSCLGKGIIFIMHTFNRQLIDMHLVFYINIAPRAKVSQTSYSMILSKETENKALPVKVAKVIDVEFLSVEPH